MKSKVFDVFANRALELGPPPAQQGPWKHWRLTLDEHSIAWLLADREGASVNTLDNAVMMELDAVLATIEGNPPRGLVLRSAKTSGFIAGADITAFRGARDAAMVEREIARAHDVVDRLEKLPIPTIAIIHGFCLGGGLEIALACQRRIAIDGARFGLPEILLGLHPGMGGTARLTRLINPVEAMGLMLTGKTVDARRARALGLVEAVTEERHVRAAAEDLVARGTTTVKRNWLAEALNLTPVRRLMGWRMRAEAAEVAPPQHYPAPTALIDLWEQHGGDRAAMLKAEQSSFARLMITDTAQNLIRVFFLREGLKKSAGKAPPVTHVHVIGAGAMGGDIAAWCAARGLRVTMGDMKPEPIAAALGRAAALYAKILKKPTDARDALDRFIPDLKGDGLRAADLVIEAVPEKLALKRTIYQDITARMKPGAWLATNTSSLPLEDLRSAVADPSRFVGLHFFNPVSRMEVVEIVSHDGASAETLSAARAFVGQIDRLPVAVKSAPGFLVNRALTPYLLEAMLMLDEGSDPTVIDAAARNYGMPMGPLELADQVGLDVCLAVGDSLRERLGQEIIPPAPAWLKQKVDAGELGRKSGKGFYLWTDGKRGAPVPVARPHAAAASTPLAPDLADIADRLILPLMNACVACLRQGIVADADTVDGAMIFGTGFAPFRGGPLQAARARGVAAIVARLTALELRHGPRFAADEGWSRIAGAA